MHTIPILTALDGSGIAASFAYSRNESTDSVSLIIPDAVLERWFERRHGVLNAMILRPEAAVELAQEILQAVDRLAHLRNATRAIAALRAAAGGVPSRTD